MINDRLMTATVALHLGSRGNHVSVAAINGSRCRHVHLPVTFKFIINKCKFVQHSLKWLKYNIIIQCGLITVPL